MDSQAYKQNVIKALTYLGQHIAGIPGHIVSQAGHANSWFTPESIAIAAASWSQALDPKAIETWLHRRETTPDDKLAGIIMAGNIPFVGLHDLLSALASGHKVLAKLSSQDEVLMKYAISLLKESGFVVEDRLQITERLNGVNFLIATGSNNSARYFEYYFRGIPSLIRKSRTSVAVLSGKETDEELYALADDIYTYFGLGCRNVTHLLLPRDMNLERLYKAYDKYMDIVHHHKYYNNYMYHKSILLMNLTKHYDNGFMLFQEKEELHAPIATLNYHYYDAPEEVNQYLDKHREQLQCIVSNIPEVKDAIALGTTQQPGLEDYADHVNTLDFLSGTVKAQKE